MRKTPDDFKSPAASSWRSMISRCYNSNAPAFHRYGGRGISVCDRWRESLRSFLDDMGPRPPGTSLDRINNDGNYEPSNCRWATVMEQARNRRDLRPITISGVTRCVSEWCEISGLPHNTLLSRIDRGWSHDRLLETATIKSKRKIFSSHEVTAIRVRVFGGESLRSISRNIGVDAGVISEMANGKTWKNQDHDLLRAIREMNITARRS